jgi:hypothetical protein
MSPPRGRMVRHGDDTSPCDENDEARAVRSRHASANSQAGRYARPVIDYPIDEPPHGNAFGENSCGTQRGQENLEYSSSPSANIAATTFSHPR